MKTVKPPKVKNVKEDKILITYKYKIKDSNNKLCNSLMAKSGLVNLVWNYCNDIQQQSVKRRRPWLSAFDLSNLTSGTSKEIDLHSATIQSICEEYAKQRINFNKPYLKFRTNKKNRNLPWIPFKASAIKVDNKGNFSFMGLKLNTWYSKQIDKNAVIKTGNITRDNCGKWFISVVCELNFSSKEEKDNYQLSLTSKGQNLTPEGCRFSEELGFDLVFQETKVRGSKNVLCQIQVTEVGDGVDLIEVYDFASWEGMKKEYPTLMHLLVEITHNVKWSAGWRENDRIFFIASMIGNEGLYDNKDTVWFDAIDGEPVLETEKPEMKVKKRKMK